MGPELPPSWFRSQRPVIGMLHLPPLPGAPGYSGDWPAVLEWALRDAESLSQGGADGMLLENFGDAPFYPRRVPVETTAHLTAVAVAVRQRFDLPLGINVLRNDGQTALAVALAAGAQFIRVNVLCGARVTDQGVIEGIAHQLLRDRKRLGAASLQILADVDVKHSAPLALRTLEQEIDETIHRGGADAVIVSGTATGRPIDKEQLEQARSAAGQTPVLCGSGATVDNVAELTAVVDGWIVGSFFKQGGRVEQPVDAERVRRFVAQGS